MFDLTSSKLLILGVVALIVVGPKELPFLLRTIGKYMAMIRRQANEFRAQFDEAMREAELDDIKKDLEAVARDAQNSIHDVKTSVERDIDSASMDLDRTLAAVPAGAQSEAGSLVAHGAQAGVVDSAAALADAAPVSQIAATQPLAPSATEPVPLLPPDVLAVAGDAAPAAASAALAKAGT